MQHPSRAYLRGLAVAATWSILACQAASTPPPAASAPAAPAVPTPAEPASPVAAPRLEDFPGTYQGAEQLARALMKPGGDPILAQALRPRPEDYARVFEGPHVDALRGGLQAQWASAGAIAARDGQTELRLIAATSDELRSGAESFPGYAPVLTALRPGFTWYRLKFIRPGESAGSHFDGLVHVQDHWALFPEPWRHVPADKRPGHEVCTKFADHFVELMVAGQEGPSVEIARQVAIDMKPDLIKECTERGTASEVECALAAKSLAELEKCADA